LFPTSSRPLEWNQNKSNITGVSGAEAAQQQNYQPDLSLTPRRPKGRRTARETMEPEQRGTLDYSPNAVEDLGGTARTDPVGHGPHVWSRGALGGRRCCAARAGGP